LSWSFRFPDDRTNVRLKQNCHRSSRATETCHRTRVGLISSRRTTPRSKATSSKLQCVRLRVRIGPHRERNISVAKPCGDQRYGHALQVPEVGTSVPVSTQHADSLEVAIVMFSGASDWADGNHWFRPSQLPAGEHPDAQLTAVVNAVADIELGGRELPALAWPQAPVRKGTGTKIISAATTDDAGSWFCGEVQQTEQTACTAPYKTGVVTTLSQLGVNGGSRPETAETLSAGRRPFKHIARQ